MAVMLAFDTALFVERMVNGLAEGSIFAMLALSWTAAFFLWRRGTLPRPLAYAYAGMAFSGWVATLAGWYTTEIGRQP